MATVKGAGIEMVQSSNAGTRKSSSLNEKKMGKNFDSMVQDPSGKIDRKAATAETQGSVKNLFKTGKAGLTRQLSPESREKALVQLSLSLGEMDSLDSGHKDLLRKIMGKKIKTEESETSHRIKADSDSLADNEDQRILSLQSEGKTTDRQELLSAVLFSPLKHPGNSEPSDSPTLGSPVKKQSHSKVEMTISVEDLRSALPKKGLSSHRTLEHSENALKQQTPTLVTAQADRGTEKGSDAVDRESGFLTELKTPDETTFSPQGAGGRLEVPAAREAAQAFQQHMTRSGNADLVRNIKFVLKDNNVGEIKLILRPESLGNVRIQLNMNENNIVGRIVVDNQSIKDAFVNNMNQLNQMLKANGFEASLDVFVGQQDLGNPGNPEEQQEEAEGLRNVAALKNLDEAVTTALPQWASYEEGALNMVM